MGTPVFILSGGDPLKRPDLFTLIEAGKQLGLRMGTIPAATPALTEDTVRRLKRHRARPDGAQPRLSRAPTCTTPSAASRGPSRGPWRRSTGRIAMRCRCRSTRRSAGARLPFLAEMVELVERLGIVFWEVFFLVPIGRGVALGGLSAEAVRGGVRDPLPRAEALALRRQGDRGAALPALRRRARGGEAARPARRCRRSSGARRDPAAPSASRRAA